MVDHKPLQGGKRKHKPEMRQKMNRDEALECLCRIPLLELGQRAFDDKRGRYGDRVTFIRNHHINPTNLCENACQFCAFSARPGDPHAYVLDETDIVSSLLDPALREAHVVGGLSREWGFTRALNLVRRVREARPDLWLKAFTAVEIDYFARTEGHGDVKRILAALMEAGVNQLPGGGAEVLSERVRLQLCRDKISPARWLEVHRVAHRMGLPSNATLLFGHIERDEEIVEHLLALRALQDEAPGFDAFIPLAYLPGLPGAPTRPVSAPRALRVVALSRLVLDNIPHIKAYWPSLHVETATLALNFGADDLDGTLGAERIMHEAEPGLPRQLMADDMEKMARDAGQMLAERDGAFRIVGRSGTVESVV